MSDNESAGLGVRRGLVQVWARAVRTEDDEDLELHAKVELFEHRRKLLLLCCREAEAMGSLLKLSKS